MKKTYEKPIVRFEDMQFDSTIAQNCAWYYIGDCEETTLLAAESCRPYSGGIDGVVYFVANDVDICSGGSFDCYHAPIATNVINMS